jgi:hypothetical protein
MEISAEAGGGPEFRSWTLYLHALRSCAGDLLASLSQMEAVEFGEHHEQVLTKVAYALEKLAEAVLLINRCVLAGTEAGQAAGTHGADPELVEGMTGVMDVVRQLHAKVTGYQRLLDPDGEDHPAWA